MMPTCCHWLREFSSISKPCTNVHSFSMSNLLLSCNIHMFEQPAPQHVTVPNESDATGTARSSVKTPRPTRRSLRRTVLRLKLAPIRNPTSRIAGSPRKLRWDQGRSTLAGSRHCHGRSPPETRQVAGTARAALRPASELAVLHHECRGIKTAPDEVKTHMLGPGAPLRSMTGNLVQRDPEGLMPAPSTALPSCRERPAEPDCPSRRISPMVPPAVERDIPDETPEFRPLPLGQNACHRPCNGNPSNRGHGNCGPGGREVQMKCGTSRRVGPTEYRGRGRSDPHRSRSIGSGTTLWLRDRPRTGSNRSAFREFPAAVRTKR